MSFNIKTESGLAPISGASPSAIDNTTIVTNANGELQAKGVSIGEGAIRFGVDENGDYGYIKAGADTVIPFKGNAKSGSVAIESGAEVSLDLGNFSFLYVHGVGTSTYFADLVIDPSIASGYYRRIISNTASNTNYSNATAIGQGTTSHFGISSVNNGVVSIKNSTVASKMVSFEYYAF